MGDQRGTGETSVAPGLCVAQFSVLPSARATRSAQMLLFALIYAVLFVCSYRPP